METKNRCYTYFKIVGDFDPDVITAKLGIVPNDRWKTGDHRRNGSLYDFSCWTCGRCDEYDVYVENQMRKTISGLLDKIDVDNRLVVGGGKVLCDEGLSALADAHYYQRLVS